MSRWPGKTVIGLTGNIATGKSVVRKMLEHLGAYGIDADALAHRAMAKGAPGYDAIIQAFGSWILDGDGQIERSRLGRIVFTDPKGLARLEAILHPLVSQAISLLIRRAPQEIIAIEAIKLLETDLAEASDEIWVVVAPEEIQLDRLISKRGMPAVQAHERIDAQSPQSIKAEAADLVISNTGSFDETWEQVQAAWVKLTKLDDTRPAVRKPAPPGELVVRRGRPEDAADIAAFLNQITPAGQPLTRNDIMAAFGEKAYLMLEQDSRITAVVGWQVENLVTRVDEIFLLPGININRAMAALINSIEAASTDLQSEAALIFTPESMNSNQEMWRQLGYSAETVKGLGVRAWQEAAVESMPRGTTMWFKRLRHDRVLRPL